MKLCDKLAKLRKAQNLSQENLAERLNVSRQAVSKWESGASYPEMEKIMQLCKILNCSLDDLVDDDAIGNKEPIETKINFNLYFKETLDFITKSFNMFGSMRFSERIKCLFEMGVYFIVLWIGWGIIGWALRSIGEPLEPVLPDLAVRIISSAFNFIYGVLGVVAIGIVLIHLFKIRYLDYFVTIEDETSHQKTVESPVEEKEEISTNNNRVFLENRRNKIIIRDSKHSTPSIFYFLAKLVLIIIKVGLAFFSLPCILGFLVLVFVIVVAFYFIGGGGFLMGMLLALTGALIINFLILWLIFNFIFNQKQALKTVFIMGIIGLLSIGAGAGLAFYNYANFSFIEEENDKTISTFEVLMAEKPVFEFLTNEQTILVPDESLTNEVKVEIQHSRFDLAHLDGRIDEYEDARYYYLYFTKDTSMMEDLNLLANDIKKKQKRNYADDIIEIRIVSSKANLGQLKLNLQDFLDRESVE